MAEQQPIVAVREVTVAFRGAVALERVSLDIPHGEFLAILGPNGSGKTTLLKVIIGILKPTAGEAAVAGGRGIGYLPQAGSVNGQFPVSAAEVVMMGRYARMGLGRLPGKADRRAVARALERVDAADLEALPIGRLSGGQRQRIFLARALVNQPPLLLLDEPTTAMDTEAVENLYALLQELHREGTTIVVVSHDVGVVSTYVERVACLNRRLVAHGRPEAVMSEEVLEEMYGCQSVFLAHGGSPHMVVRKH